MYNYNTLIEDLINNIPTIERNNNADCIRDFAIVFRNLLNLNRFSIVEFVQLKEDNRWLTLRRLRRYVF